MLGLCVVELLGRYSKLTLPLKRSQIDPLLAAEPRPAPASTAPVPRVHSASRRLGPEAVQQLVADYQAGIPSTQLMQTYGLGKGTVLRLLRQHGVQLRNQPMTPDQIHQAIQLYETGNSLAAVGQAIGFDHTVIRNAFERAGIPRRDSHGRPR